MNGIRVCLLVFGAWCQVAVAESLPQRNLMVSWRVTSSVQSTAVTASPKPSRGGYSLGSDDASGAGHAHGAGGWSAQTRDVAESQEQSLMVINGGQGRLFIGQSRPQTTWQWSWSGSAQSARSGGSDNAAANSTAARTADTSASAVSSASTAAQQPMIQAWAQTTWVDLGQGLTVKPSWPGGRAAVKVVFEAKAVQPGRMTDPDGVTRRLEAASTLLLPMGQWVTVARSGDSYEGDGVGTLSTRSIRQQAGEQLEIRISLP